MHLTLCQAQDKGLSHLLLTLSNIVLVKFFKYNHLGIVIKRLRQSGLPSTAVGSEEPKSCLSRSAVIAFQNKR